MYVYIHEMCIYTYIYMYEYIMMCVTLPFGSLGAVKGELVQKVAMSAKKTTIIYGLSNGKPACIHAYIHTYTHTHTHILIHAQIWPAALHRFALNMEHNPSCSTFSFDKY